VRDLQNKQKKSLEFDHYKAACAEQPEDSARSRFGRYFLGGTKSNSRLPALLCALILLICALATHPVAEIGMIDDWTYIKSAQVLAQTGHIVYNGWATAMVGWQLFLGALFARIFGPSFTAIRASTLPIALATAFLTQRSLVRVGINSRNATLGTLTLVLSPLFLPLALSFMTDIGGLFCIVLCLYACLRALQAETHRAALAWLAFAAFSNALGGTVRQIAWLGVLVMFPSTIWLLRRRPHLLFAGVLLYGVSSAFIFGCLRWFLRQPYSLSGPLIPVLLDGQHIVHLVLELVTVLFSSAMFLLPLLLAFTRAISLRNRQTVDFLILSGVLCLIAGLFLCLRHPHSFAPLLAPYGGNYVAASGLVEGTPIQGKRPIVLQLGVRVLLTFLVLGALNCFLAFLYGSRQLGRPAQTHTSWKSLLILLVPFTLAYLIFLLPYGLTSDLFDRYSLPLLLIGLILLLRLFEDRVKANLPTVSIVLIALFALYAVAGTHDAFSLFRAKAAAIAELQAAGFPATSIDGGFEHNGMTQIERFGHMNDPRIRIPANIYVAYSSPFPNNCEPFLALLTPAIVPGYTLSFDPAACGGPSDFPPITYYNWVGFHRLSLYIVHTVKKPSRLFASETRENR
jgi:drug/metabolite transporter superfamily protein YnfA